MAKKQAIIETDDVDEELLAQMKLMTLHLARMRDSLDDIVRLLSRSQISPS